MQPIKTSVHELVMFAAKLFAVLLGLLFVTVTSIYIYFYRQQAVINSEQRSLSVNGKAERKVSPDSATVTVGLQSTATKAVEVQALATTSMNTFGEKLKALGVISEKIHTTLYNLTPNYTEAQTIKNYTVNLEVTVTLEKTSLTDSLVTKVLTAATESGLNEVKGLYYYLADQEKVTRELETEAVADAKSLAVQRAKIGGFNLGAIKSIQFDGYPIAYDMVATNAPTVGGQTGSGSSSEAIAKEDIRLAPGELDIQKNVVITYEIY